MNFFDTDLVTKTKMKTLVIIQLLVLLSSFTSEKESEEYLIMQTMVDYVDEWDVKIEKKYNNTDFLNEISVTKQSCEMWGDSVMKGIHGGLCIHDSFMLVEGLEFDLTYVTSTLEKTNRRRLERSFRDKQPGEGIIRFSYPVLSSDGNNAIVYVNSFTSPLAATVELFILKKTDGKWQVKDRILKQIS